MSSILNARPVEIVVRLQMLTTAEGGRTAPANFLGGQYRPQLSLDGVSGSTSFLVESLDDGEQLRPGAAATARGWLLVPEVLGKLESGMGITLREGARVVARGSIIRASPTP